jgi:hypothetical protein
MRHVAVVLIVAAALSACTSGRRFKTHVKYAAPKGLFEVVIEASGFMKPLSDTAYQSRAEIDVTPVGLGSGVPLHVTMTLPAAPGARKLSELVREAGLWAHEDELSELDRVVDLALFGPKTTLVAGQTRALRVVETKFD